MELRRKKSEALASLAIILEAIFDFGEKVLSLFTIWRRLHKNRVGFSGFDIGEGLGFLRASEGGKRATCRSKRQKLVLETCSALR